MPSGAQAHQPLKRKAQTARLLLLDKDGGQTPNKTEEATAVKAYIAVRGRGTLMAYADLAGKARARKRTRRHIVLDPKAVVGVLDLRRRAAIGKEGKSHGPSCVAGDLYKAAPAEATAVIDSLSVEATVSADIPLDWQGATGACC